MASKKKKSVQKTTKPSGSARKKSVKTKTAKSRKSNKQKSAGKQNNQPGKLSSDIASPFPVVGLGASAGGLEALEEFFRAMSVASGMGFVVVMHQAAKHVSLLPELLSKCTEMNVVAIVDGMTVRPNCVYIVPPGKNVDLLDGKLYLTAIPEKHLSSLPIDHFFRSLAVDRKEKSVAIVLSGTGTDGTVGLSAIKGESGMVMVQSIKSAKFNGMPKNAIDAGWADYILTPKKMPDALVAYARGPFLKTLPSKDQPGPGIASSLPAILLLLRRRCGHDFSGYKPSTISRRIERRMNVHQIDKPKNYLRYLDEHESEAGVLFKDLLIGVTSFFRDPWAFESLAKKAIIKVLKEKPADANFRVWVPGCATGEEAYSLAILLRECMDELKVHLNIQIFATDLDNDAIETARNGRFAAGIGTDVSASRLAQFFTKHDGSYQIRKELRDWLVFAPQNVVHDPPFTKLDLISCRNLLIYLQSELQKKLLTLFHYSLRDGGYMFLGTSESIGEFNDLFDTVDSKAKIFRRKTTTSHLNRNVKFPITALPKKAARKKTELQTQAMPDFDAAILDMLVSRFAPPTVIVNEIGEILYVHGRTGLFLELAQGGPPKDVIMMAREGLELDLGTALREAIRQTAPVVHKNIPVKTNGDTVLIDLFVERITDSESLDGLLRISFQIVTDTEPQLPANATLTNSSKQKATSRQKELEQELQHTRESLQRSIEELDASNEEMKSTNEELQSTNEELQSTNEELETSKEELQSLNEELQTVNAEFQEKIHDLSRANDDMANLLNSIDIATIFLDNQLCIKRYTDQAIQVIRLIPTDLGRHLGDLTSKLEDHDLVADCEEVLKTLLFKECEVQTVEGHWLLMRILPYRTSDDRIDGLVMNFIDINELKTIQDKIQQAREFAESIVATVREPLVVLDGAFCVTLANKAFYRVFQTSSEATIGKSIYSLGRGQWDVRALRELLETVLPQNTTFDDFEIYFQFPDSRETRLMLNARRIPVAAGEPSLILLAIEETKT